MDCVEKTKRKGREFKNILWVGRAELKIKVKKYNILPWTNADDDALLRDKDNSSVQSLKEKF